ncbi:hypothetical protein [Rhizobium sophoriradicis]|nr:hypothetical protein [Rhizobium sophoriradicis]
MMFRTPAMAAIVWQVRALDAQRPVPFSCWAGNFLWDFSDF